jgi:GNAT superfamily N-acetyltransferase
MRRCSPLIRAPGTASASAASFDPPRIPTVAEVAVVVDDDWQGRGLATALLDDLSARARQTGISQFSASVLAHNEEALDLFRQVADARVTGTDHGIVELIMDIPEEGIPEALRHTVRAAASGHVEHPGGP